MVMCAVYGCSHRSTRDPCSLYRFPKIRKKSSPELQSLAEERRNLWLLRIGRSDLTESRINNARVCSDHFVTGIPAKLKDVKHVDWVPSLKLGHQLFENKDEEGNEDLKELLGLVPDSGDDSPKKITFITARPAFSSERTKFKGSASKRRKRKSRKILAKDSDKAEDDLSQDQSNIDSEPPCVTSGDKLKYFIYESKPNYEPQSSDSENVTVVNHQQALNSAKTLLHYMMNQDDVSEAEMTLIVGYIKKISDKLQKEE